MARYPSCLLLIRLMNDPQKEARILFRILRELLSSAEFSRIQTTQNGRYHFTTCSNSPSTARIHDASHVNRNAFGHLCPRQTPGRHRIFSHLVTPAKQRKRRGISNNASGASPMLSYAYRRTGRAFFIRISHLSATNRVNSPRRSQHVKEYPG
jgi:hypothetical protein